MTRDELLQAASAYADGELSDAQPFLDQLAASPEAQQFLADIERLRRMVRYEAVAEFPDIVDRVVESLPPRHG